MISLEKSISLVFDQNVKDLAIYLGRCATIRTPCDASLKKYAHLSEPQKSIEQVAEVLARDLYSNKLDRGVQEAKNLTTILGTAEKIALVATACKVFANPKLSMPSRLSMVFAASSLVYEIPCAKSIAGFDVVLATCFYTGCFAGIQNELVPASMVSKYVAKGAELLGITFSERHKNEKTIAISATNSVPSTISGSDPDDSPHKPGSAWRDIGYR